MLSPTDGLAYDWVTDKLYWTDACTDQIEVYDIANDDRKVLITTGSGSAPRGIVVDPGTGLVVNTGTCTALNHVL